MSLNKPKRTKRTLLIIDDDQFIIGAMWMALKQAGYNVLTAGNGKAAIEIISQQNVDLIIVDLMMPVMDGLAFLRWLRQEAKLNTPTLVQSAMLKSDTKIKVMEAGANDILYKPAKPLDLIAKIQELEKLL